MIILFLEEDREEDDFVSEETGGHLFCMRTDGWCFYCLWKTDGYVFNISFIVIQGAPLPH